jgi:tetratricopeptide (TPR) repeat protein
MKLFAVLFCMLLISSVIAQSTDLAVMRGKLEAGDYKTVIVQLEPLVKQKPNDPDAHFLLARAYYLTGGALNQARAEDQIRLAIRLVSFRAEFEWQYGLILEALGKADLALIHLRTAVMGDPKGVSNQSLYRYAMDWGSVAWRKGDLRQALEAFQAASRINPSQPWALVHQTALHLGLNEARLAEPLITRCLKLLETGNYAANHPVWAEAYYWYGQTLEALSRFSEAKSAYLKALEHDPKFSRARDAFENLRSK